MACDRRHRSDGHESRARLGVPSHASLLVSIKGVEISQDHQSPSSLPSSIPSSSFSPFLLFFSILSPVSLIYPIISSPFFSFLSLFLLLSISPFSPLSLSLLVPLPPACPCHALSRRDWVPSLSSSPDSPHFLSLPSPLIGLFPSPSPSDSWFVLLIPHFTYFWHFFKNFSLPIIPASSDCLALNRPDWTPL